MTEGNLFEEFDNKDDQRTWVRSAFRDRFCFKMETVYKLLIIT